MILPNQIKEFHNYSIPFTNYCRIRRSKPQITNQPIRKSWLMWFVGFADGVRRCILHSSSIDLFDFVSSLPPSINHIDHECSMQPYCYNIFSFISFHFFKKEMKFNERKESYFSFVLLNGMDWLKKWWTASSIKDWKSFNYGVMGYRFSAQFTSPSISFHSTSAVFERKQKELKWSWLDEWWASWERKTHNISSRNIKLMKLILMEGAALQSLHSSINSAKKTNKLSFCWVFFLSFVIERKRTK